MPKTIDSLPLEVLHQILFEALTGVYGRAGDLCRYSLVSRTWRIQAQSLLYSFVKLWRGDEQVGAWLASEARPRFVTRTLMVGPSKAPFSEECVIKMLKECPSLESLVVDTPDEDMNGNLTDELLGNLRHLHLHHPDVAFDNYAMTGSHGPPRRLRHLELELQNVSDSFQIVMLPNGIRVFNSSVVDFVSASATSLRRLALRRIAEPSAVLRALQVLHGSATVLQQLELTFLDDMPDTFLRETMAIFRHLQKLVIDSDVLPDPKLLEAPVLRYLELQGTSGENMLQRFANSLADVTVLPMIKRIAITCCAEKVGFTSGAGLALAEACRARGIQLQYEGAAVEEVDEHEGEEKDDD